uniref:EMI domain-containing protein n=1 Tax=Rhabditophanes sp. KR3021 TaxID=114890 RepID=A0AC35UBZ4_9BILA
MAKKSRQQSRLFMAYLLLLLPIIISAAINTKPEPTGDNVCEDIIVVNKTIRDKVHVKSFVTKEVPCTDITKGFSCTVQEEVSKVEYQKKIVPENKTIAVCCQGYYHELESNTCQLLCDAPCIHGKCVSRNYCECDKGYNQSNGTVCDVSCEKGYWGNDCRSLCDQGSYGDHCKNTCTCDDGHICDPIIGCCVEDQLTCGVATRDQLIMQKASNKQNIVYGAILIVVCVCLLGTFTIYYRKKYRKERDPRLPDVIYHKKNLDEHEDSSLKFTNRLADEPSYVAVQESEFADREAARRKALDIEGAGYASLSDVGSTSNTRPATDGNLCMAPFLNKEDDYEAYGEDESYLAPKFFNKQIIVYGAILIVVCVCLLGTFTIYYRQKYRNERDPLLPQLIYNQNNFDTESSLKFTNKLAGQCGYVAAQEKEFAVREDARKKAFDLEDINDNYSSVYDMKSTSSTKPEINERFCTAPLINEYEAYEGGYLVSIAILQLSLFISISAKLPSPNVCQVYFTVNETITKQETKLVNITKYFSCPDFLKNFRCPITKEVSVVENIDTIIPVNKVRLFCCEGYFENDDGKCVGLCDSSCEHGKCVGRNECQCKKGFAGTFCEYSCKSGFWGKDCKSLCEEGTFGDRCEQTCACQDDQICDSIIGCCEKDSLTCGIKKFNGSLWKIFIYGSSATIVFIVLLAGLIIYYRTKYQKECDPQGPVCWLPNAPICGSDESNFKIENPMTRRLLEIEEEEDHFIKTRATKNCYYEDASGFKYISFKFE